MPLIGDVPTIAEQGVPGFESGTWQGVLVANAARRTRSSRGSTPSCPHHPHARHPRPPAGQGAEVVTMTAAEQDQFFAKERARWAQVVSRGQHQARLSGRLDTLISFLSQFHWKTGGTGEFFSLTGDEYPGIIQTAVDTCRGKVPIIAGAGGPTRFAIQCAQAAERPARTASCCCRTTSPKPARKAWPRTSKPCARA
jgi:hypothetical protein